MKGKLDIEKSMYELHHFDNCVENPPNNKKQPNPALIITEQTVLWLKP